MQFFLLSAKLLSVMKKLTFKHTIVSCFVGYVVQAVVCNFAPLLFVTFSNEFNISLSKITALVTVTFVVQILVDFIAAKYVDKIGYRQSLVLAHVLSALGFVMMGVLPDLFDPFVALLLSVTVYSIGSGLLEVLISPVVESCPTKNKKGMMSLLHSFYCWGSVAVILLSTVFFAIFGRDNWRVLSMLWAVLPVVNCVFLFFVPINTPVEEDEKIPVSSMAKNKMFFLLILLMVAAGASEQAMSQWASTFAETGLHVSKSVGDLAGPCLFAVLMGSARLLYSFISEKVNLVRYMTFSSVLCIAAYLLASLSGNAVVSLIGCGLCGFSVGVLWPGTISIAAKHLKNGGTALFALLALAGDMGCTVGPTAIGLISDHLGSVKSGLIYGIVFPLLLIAGLIGLRKIQKVKTKNTADR